MGIDVRNAYKCMQCGQYKDTYPEIQDHYVTVHNAPSPNIPDIKNAYKCHKCNTYKDTTCDLIIHYRQSH